MSDDDVKDVDDIQRLCSELGRPLKTMLALSATTDPFYAGRESRRRGAEWFAELWHRYEFGHGVHIRRVHYTLISKGGVKHFIGDDGYINTEKHWSDLKCACRDARILGLVPFEAIEDHRSEGVVEYLVTAESDAMLWVTGGQHQSETLPLWSISTSLFGPPNFEFVPASVDQRYHLELWAEKSTVNDITMPLARRYRINALSGAGDMSWTDVYKLVKRAQAGGRPVRILYISDFDPQGHNMPVAVARKIEFLNRTRNLGLDIQVRPVVLTHEQTVEYELPRTPLKDSVGGKGRFEERYGAGATELDALEALHPGVLEQILVDEIERYHDGELEDRVEEIADDFRSTLEMVHDEVVEQHQEVVDDIKANLDDLVSKANAEIAVIREKYAARYAEIIERFNVTKGCSIKT
jgi:hypothetical protein